MALRAVDGGPGAPWRRERGGALDELTVESDVLGGNPLGDPALRPLYVYRPADVVAGRAGRVPSIYVIQGYSGQVDMWQGRSAFQPTMIERLDDLFALSDCPAGVIVFVDAWTSLGGSQFLNSTSTGRYLDYLCDEVVPFVDSCYPTLSDRDHRGIAGHSSGGYGAMVVPMLRPDVFGALASHAGDALFECCYQRDFPGIARGLRDHFDGSYEALLEQAQAADPFDWVRFGTAFSMYAYAAAYTPDPERPGKALLPFETATGRLVPAVWERWLELDPVRMAPRRVEALGSMRRIVLEAGRSDEYFLDLGAEAFSAELRKLGVEHTLGLFDGRHGGVSYRYPAAIEQLLLALAG